MMVVFDMGEPSSSEHSGYVVHVYRDTGKSSPMHGNYNWIWGFDTGYVVVTGSSSVYR